MADLGAVPEQGPQRRTLVASQNRRLGAETSGQSMEQNSLRGFLVIKSRTPQEELDLQASITIVAKATEISRRAASLVALQPIELSQPPTGSATKQGKASFAAEEKYRFCTNTLGKSKSAGTRLLAARIGKGVPLAG